MRAFFYDTWAFVALANAGDPYHDLAAQVDRALELGGWVGATTDYVFDETLTGLHAAAGAKTALTVADALLAQVAAGDLMLIDVHAGRRTAALSIFRRLAPSSPRLSFTDCTSFAVMRELGVRFAFTADKLFRRAGAGIRPLLERRGSDLRAVMPA